MLREEVINELATSPRVDPHIPAQLIGVVVVVDVVAARAIVVVAHSVVIGAAKKPAILLSPNFGVVLDIVILVRQDTEGIAWDGVIGIGKAPTWVTAGSPFSQFDTAKGDGALRGWFFTILRNKNVSKCTCRCAT